MRLLLISLSHHRAPVELRERLSFGETEATAFLSQLTGHPDVQEALLLSTCNRTELLVRHAPLESARLQALPDMLRHHLVQARGGGDEAPPAWEIYRDEEAVQHMLEVVSGLHSMILGESQILAQVREAYRICCCAGSNGFFLNRMMHQVLRAGKRVRSETDIGSGAVSVGQAAVDLLVRELGSLHGLTALVVGAGEMSEQILRRLVDLKLKRVVVLNRTEGRARTLAASMGVESAPLTQLDTELLTADFCLIAIDVATPLLTCERLAPMAGRAKPVSLVDISVPRSIDAGAAELPGVRAFNIDHLQGLVTQSLVQRESERPKAQVIIAETLTELKEWYLSLEVVPLIQQLYRRFEEVRREEVERVGHAFDAEALAHVDEVTRRLLRKVLHGPVNRIRSSVGESGYDNQFWAHFLKQAFPLGEEDATVGSNESGSATRRSPDGGMRGAHAS